MTPQPLDDAQATERERSAFFDAVRASTQTVPGLFAWGVVTGAAMMQSGLSLWQSLLMTLVVYAGSAQLAALPLIAAGAPVWVIAFTAFMVNLRFVIFSAVIGPHFRHLSWRRRLFYGYHTLDVVMGFFPQRFPSHTLGQAVGKQGYFSGLAVSSWLAWQIGSLTGIFLAQQIPASWGIGFAGSLALLAIAIPLVRNRPTIVGVAVACTVAVATVQWPYRLGLVTAMLLGIVAAVFAEQLMVKPKDTV